MEETAEVTYRIEKCDGKVQWDEFILEHDGHPMQLWGWGEVRAAEKWHVDRIFIVENDQQIGAVQLLIHKLSWPFGAYVYVARGPVIAENPTGVYEQLIAYVKANYRAVALIVEPNSDDEPSGEGWHENGTNTLETRTIVLDLSKADGVLLAEMDPAIRQQLRTATESHVSVRKIGNPEDITACYQLYKQTATKQGLKPHKERYFHTLSDKLGDFSVLYGAFDGEILVGYLWLIVSEASAFELYAATTEQGKGIGAEAALRWEAIRRVKQWGVPVYDIGGVAMNDETDHKHGFGNHYADFGVFVMPLSPLYTLWKKSGAQHAGNMK